MNSPDTYSIINGFVPYPTGVGQGQILGSYDKEAAAKQEDEVREYQRKQAQGQVHILAASLAAEARREGESFSELAEEIGGWLLRSLDNVS